MNTQEIVDKCLAVLRQMTCVKSHAIGFEPNIHAGDYPIARIVIDRETRGLWCVTVAMTIYIGDSIPLHEGDKSREQEARGLAGRALDVLQEQPGWRVRYLDTVFDSDRMPGFKIGALRVEITA